MTWLTPAPTLVGESIRAPLAHRYRTVRLGAAGAALPIALIASLLTSDPSGYACSAVLAVLGLHALVCHRRRQCVEWALAVDATAVGLIAVITRLPIAAGMGAAFLGVTISLLVEGPARRWLQAYALLWLAGTLTLVLVGGGSGHSVTVVWLFTVGVVAFFLSAICAMVMAAMEELGRRDYARAEAARLLAENEARFRTLVQETFDAVAVVDASREIVYASDSYERVTGFPREGTLDMTMAGRVHPSDVGAVRRILAWAARHPGETCRGRIRTTRDEGGWRTLEVALTNLLSDPAISGLVCNLRDVSEQVQAERALRASERRFRSAFEGAPIGMALLSLEGAFLSVNPALARLLGYPAEELLSMNWKDVGAPGDPDPQEAIAALLAGAAGSSQMERRQVRADGSVRECSISLSIVCDSGSRHHHLIMQMADITDLKCAQRVLEQALRGKDEFVASISHELRTPLTAVIGFGNLLRVPSQLSAQEQQETVEVLTSQAAEVARIVEDLLVAARSDDRQLHVASVPVDLRAQAAEVLSGWAPGELACVVLESGTERAQGDPTRVRQILRNLILNALRYGGEHVRIATRHGGGIASVLVADDGAGIPEDARDRVFQPYQQAHKGLGVTAAVGIGLTVSRRLAQLMGGDLTYCYEEGESVFELSLPEASLAEDRTADAGAPARDRAGLRREMATSTAAAANEPRL